MNNEAFINGVLKAAEEASSTEPPHPGYGKSQESALGRYLAMKSLASSARVDSPLEHPILSAAFSKGGLTNGLRERYNKSKDRTVHDTLGQTVRKSSLSNALRFGVLGAGLGGIASGNGPDEGAVERILKGVGAGAGIGVAGGAIGGAARGALDSAILKNTGHDSDRRAVEMKSRHPFATSLPFGDAAGAIFG